MTLLALSSGHKLGLALAGGAFVVFSLVSAMLIPRYRPQFPGRRGLPLYVAVTILFFVGMMGAVLVFGAESKEAEAAVKVTEVDYKIKLPPRRWTPGTYTFDLRNDGKQDHNLTFDGPGVHDEATPTIPGGGTAKLTVELKAGTYELYCSVPGHKQLGMDLNIQVR